MRPDASGPRWSEQAILSARGPKSQLDPWRPYAFHVESEVSRFGTCDPVATLFLTNRECPLRCTMCDLWKQTLDETVPIGAIPAQIDYALERLPKARHIKLYNSGNFFDPAAIPPHDYPAILERTSQFDTIIVENHPRFVNQKCWKFHEGCSGRLEIAMGLETIQPEVLPRLNKQMSLADFERAARELRKRDITLRVFILLQPPFCRHEEAVDWCVRTIQYAFDHEVDCCSVVPTRGGNGAMEQLAAQGWYQPPTLAQMEAALEAGLRLRAGRVFMDVWDAERFAACPACGPARIERLVTMNQTQRLSEPIACDRCGD